MADYSKALELDPNLGGVLSRRGRFYLDQNKLGEAISDFSEAIRAEPEDATIYAWRALAYARQGETELALTNFESALRLDRSIAWIYLERGDLFIGQKQFSQAVADYSEAIRLEPKDVNAWRARSHAFHLAHRPEDEIADLAQMLRLDPRNEFALEHRALACAREGDTSLALAAYDDWIRYTQSQKAYDSRWRFLARQGEYGQLAGDLRKAVAAGVVERSVHLRLAWLLATCPDPAVRNGKEAVAEAIKAGEAKEEKDPHSLDVLAAALAEAGDFTQAASSAEEAIERQKGDSDLRQQMRNRLELYRKGQPYRAPPPQRRTGGDEGARE